MLPEPLPYPYVYMYNIITGLICSFLIHITWLYQLISFTNPSYRILTLTHLTIHVAMNHITHTHSYSLMCTHQVHTLCGIQAQYYGLMCS